MSRILVVDDEPAIGWSLRELLGDAGHAVEVASSAEAALDACGRFAADAILLDVRLPGRDGLSAIPDLRAAAPGAPIVVMTAFGDLDTAVRTVQAGAYDYLVKPFDLERVSAVVARALADRAAGPCATSPEDETPAPAALVGGSPAMQEVFKQIAILAATDLPVLVRGGTGTGKELAARAIHDHGRRRDGPFLVTSLAALAPNAVEGELFGLAASAESAGRPGLFELAAGGTLFLAEIDAAEAAVQVRLLRLLETGEFTRVGCGMNVPADVRIIAATERSPEALAAGGFRRELFDRLRVCEIAMPTLAARRDDIELLARGFLARFTSLRSQPRTPTLSAEFLSALRDRPWPGNVRELRHVVERAAVVARGGTLRPEHLPPSEWTGPIATELEAAAAAVTAAVKSWASAARRALGGLPEPDLHHRAVLVVEATLLREALAHAGGNRTAAARLLGLDRATLRTKLRLLGIDD